MTNPSQGRVLGETATSPEARIERMIKSALIIAAGEAFFQLVVTLKNKFLAVRIGPEGLGAFELLAAFFFLFVGLLQNWIAPTTVRFVSSLRSEQRDAAVRFVSALTISGCVLFSALAVIPVVLFPGWVRERFLSAEVLPAFILLYAVWFVASGGFNLTKSYLLVEQRFPAVSGCKVFAALIELALVVTLTWWLGLTGFFVALGAGALASFGFAVRLGRPALRLPSLAALRGQRELVHRLLRFSGANFVIGVLFCTTYYLLRKQIQVEFGLAALGIFYGCYTLMMSVELIAKAVNAYAFSELCRTQPLVKRNREMDHYVYLITLVLTPLCTGMILFADGLVPTLFAQSFAEMRDYLHVMVLFIYLHNVLYIFDVNLMGLERNREHLLVVAVQHLLSYLLAVWWLRSHGLVGVAWGLLAGSQVSLLLAGVICSRLGCRLDVAIVTRFGISVAALAAAIGLRDAPLEWRMLSWAGLVAVMLGCILPAHRLHLWQCLRQFTLSPVPR